MTSSVVVISSTLGIYVYEDREMRLMQSLDDVTDSDSIIQSLSLVSSFVYESAAAGALIQHQIEHKYELPNELYDFFHNIITKGGMRLQRSKWSFVSQTLGEIAAVQFKLQWLLLRPSSQRFLYDMLPSLLGVSKSLLCEAERELSLILYSLDQKEENNMDEYYEEEQEITEAEIAYNAQWDED